MGIKKLRFYYNSYLGYKSEVSIEIESGKVFYKSNFDKELSFTQPPCLNGHLADHESFFLVNKDRSKHFGEYANLVLNWNPYYGIGPCIDGSYWNMTFELADGSKKELIGENGEPDDFDDFVYRFERLINKQLSYVNRYAPDCYLKTGRFFGNADRLLILFPADYFDIKSIDLDFSSEYETVCQIPELNTAFFNYDGFVSGDPIKIYPKDYYTGDCIYRGWMLKPEQYKTLYDYLQNIGISLINTPEEYNACHLFPNAICHGLQQHTPHVKVYADGEKIDWDIVNGLFKRFMIKDYVKSVKETAFPEYFKTPVNAHEMEKRIFEFIDLRGKLYTHGIVIKEYVNLRKYGETTNEYRAFFLDNNLLSLSRNSNQHEICNHIPIDYVKQFCNMPSKYYTVDFGELSDGKWIVLETGDGQVSGLSPNQNTFKYYDDMRRMLF